MSESAAASSIGIDLALCFGFGKMQTPRPSPPSLLLALGLLAAAPLLPGCGEGRTPWTPADHPAVDLEARVARWVGHPSAVAARDGTVLGKVQVDRCLPVPPGEIPLHVHDAFLAAEDPGPCLPGEDGTAAPLLDALDDTPAVLEDPDARAERCSALRALAFGDEADSCLPWLPLPEGGWLPRSDPDAVRAAWMNLADLGQGDYGVEAAARRWFDRGASALTLSQAALLAAAATSPEARSDEKLLRRARDRVLRRMEERGAATRAQVVAAMAEDVPLRRPHVDPSPDLASFMEGVRRDLREHLGGSLLLRRGGTVVTTLDAPLQDAAKRAVAEGQDRWERNRKTEAKTIRKVLDKHGTDPEALAQAKVPDGAYLEVPEDHPQAAVLGMEPDTGRVAVLFDGRPEHEVARFGAMHLERQAGSSFKTFVYATAIHQGYSEADVLTDRRYAFEVPDRDEPWTPKNHLDKYYNQVTLRFGLAQSLNSVAIQLAVKVGPSAVVDLCRRLGISSRLRAVPALALGASPVSLAEMVAAYATFPAGGRRVVPRFVDAFEAATGRYDFPLPPPVQAIDPGVAYVMVDMLRAVVQGGTGTAAKKLPFPVGGKTGTTNESADTWFVGFSSRLALGVWFGFDDGLPLGGDETGGSLALPVWREVMAASAGDPPPPDFPVPPGIAFEERSVWNGAPMKEGRRMAFVEPVRARWVVKHPKDSRPLEDGEVVLPPGPRLRLAGGELREYEADPEEPEQASP
ncbi:transglycosylase domain-containing protein [Myxococcota bacterium]|nr:transglycosylase domain-containing protein [Myxococcota bacterium]